MLRALGYDRIERFHMNEGHASLLTLEILDEEAKKAGRESVTRSDIEAVKGKCTFTTHTPVPAGHDQFPIDLMRRVLGDRDDFLDMKDVYCTDLVAHILRQRVFAPKEVIRGENKLNMTYLGSQQIHSVLYIPLKVNDLVNYFLVFDAQAEHRSFTDEQIEILTFFGKELMKGLRLEKMSDILHDFKNPSIAVAGFAKRIQKILKGGDYPKNEKVDQALDILLKETSRIQEMALTLYEKEKESIIDLTEVSERCFLINKEALKELNRRNVQLIEQKFESPLWVRCSPLHIERVLDNLLNNASKAIPEEGGELSIRSYRKDTWAVVEINNTGQISEEERDRFTLGGGRGRGLHISIRLVKNMKGVLSVESGRGQTTFCVMLPLVEPKGVKDD